KGELITELFTERRTLTPLKEIPVDLQNAVLSIEDNDFFKHWGVSPRGIARAAMSNLAKGRVAQGGSTITQQLAKTIFLTPDRTMSRKIKELLLTLQLERNYSKEEILQLYLNQIYFGSGAYGVEAAARVYFSKHVRDLNLAECAMLGGLPRAPNYYSPFHNPERALTRRATVLRRMRELKYITAADEKQANAVALNTEKIAIPTAVAPYFIEYVRTQLEPKYGNDMIYRGGLSIYTTLDIKAQKAAEKAMGEALTAFDANRSSYFEAKKIKPVAIQGALLAIDPKTGGIRAMVGGRDFRQSQFNRATQAKRQPGSAFKPFVYTAALENGFSPATVLEDTPLVYVNNGRDWELVSRDPHYLTTIRPDWVKDPMKVWTPENFGKKYYDKVLLRTAIEHSLNSCAIKVLDEIGPMRAIDYARRMGITTPLTNTLSLALGASDVTLLEMVGAFGVFASGGIKTQPYAIVRIEDRDGKILEENIPHEQEVLSPQTCFVMTNLLRGVVQHGTGTAAQSLGRPCAGKTGTTNDFSDAWFVGYTPQLATGVWVGYDDRNSLGDKMTGGRIACPIWTSFMQGALAGEPVINFTPPEGIDFVLIDPKTGLLALSKTPGAYLEAFDKGTEPTDYFPKETSSMDTSDTTGTNSSAAINQISEDEAGF
ncbi:MAG: PBP1A family penicillin-binding protein, partial [Endomicrobiales bacterium]